MSFQFADFTVDLDRFQLRRGNDVIPLEPKVFDLLLYLADRRERVVTKRELLENLWSGEHVTESVLTTNVRTLRRVVGDDGRAQRVIKTVHGRGYRFVASLREAEERQGGRPFVGRETVISVLSNALDDSIGGTGRLVLLSGEPGIGREIRR